jgi:ariadne-1
MENIHENWEFIAETGDSIRAILLADESNSQWMTEVVDYYHENESFRPDLYRQVERLLDNLRPNNPNIPKLIKAFRGIVYNDDCPENGDNLCVRIFVPGDEEEEADREMTPAEDGDEPLLEEIHYVIAEPAITPARLREREDSACLPISVSLSLPPPIVFQLLQEYCWSDDRLLHPYVENPTNVLARIGFTPATVNEDSLTLSHPSHDDECSICFDDFAAADLFGMSCGHYFCRDCLVREIELKLKSRSPIIRCLQHGCNRRFFVTDVDALCGPATASAFESAILEAHVMTDPHLRPCIRADCPLILTVHALGRCNVATCACGQRICWKCRQEAHAPLSCPLVSKWGEITQEETLQARWLTENTKNCPRCHTQIEKNGGCNHMTCRTTCGGGCGYEFCWICGHEWHTHTGNAYNCNKFADFNGKPGELAASDLKRLNHYHTRFMNHMRSKAVEKEAREGLTAKILDIFKTPGPNALSHERAEAELTHVFAAVDLARSVLVWSYPHAFYMKPGSVELRLFEHVQTDVESYLEDLTYLIEHQPWTPPAEFQKKANILAGNTEVLNKHVDQYSK